MDAPATATPYRVHSKVLFALYAIIPAVALLVIADTVWFDQGLKRHHLPSQPDEWAFWTVIFSMPHIVASVMMMADPEYLHAYGRRMVRPVVGIIAFAIGAPFLLGTQAFFLIFAFYTMYHVLGQQFGLTLMMLGRKPDRWFSGWKWISVVASFLIYAAIFAAAFMEREVLGHSLTGWARYAAAALLVLATALAWRLSRESRTTIGRWYLWANVAMLGVCYWLWRMEYSLFVIVIPRIIHDVTAYAVYTVHDQNRNAISPKNWFYRATAFTRVPPLILCPVLSIFVAYVALRNHLFFTSTLIYSLGLFHYYIEGFIWKRDSAHRQHVSFAV